MSRYRDPQLQVGENYTYLQILILSKMKLNEWGLRPPLCTYRLNWARWTSRRWWDALQTQNSKFDPWWSEAEHATTQSLQRLPTILNLHEWAGKKQFVYLKFECQSMARALDLKTFQRPALTTSPPPFDFDPYSAGIDFSRHKICRRQILTTKDDPRTVRVNIIYNGRRPIT